ncbi:MAG TPA: EscN/YscN/HrcN family type III secretion system ATPase, partial [Pirellulales bacterium]|nr:EscN/YscN/HrcN family type III secretion system ATPase [Pirellulales bacterium]
MPSSVDEIRQQIELTLPTALTGSVVRMSGLTAAVADFPAPLGAQVLIERDSGLAVEAEVIGFRDDLTLVSLLSDAQGLRHGNRVRLIRTARWLRVGAELLGRVIDARGRAIDGRPQPALGSRAALERAAPQPIERPRIDHSLSTGVRVIDGLLTCGQGQRLGIFAGSGVGKSVTLG